jgi:hypothetical protein
MHAGRLVVGLVVLGIMVMLIRQLDAYQATPSPVTRAGRVDMHHDYPATAQDEPNAKSVVTPVEPVDEKSEALSLDSEESHQHQQSGLTATELRALLSYLHLKLGEEDNDPSALQLQDLNYLGVYEQDEGMVHYWLLPNEGNWDRYVTATVVGDHQLSFSLSFSGPPDVASSEQPPMEPDPGTEEEPDFFSLP